MIFVLWLKRLKQRLLAEEAAKNGLLESTKLKNKMRMSYAVV